MEGKKFLVTTKDVGQGDMGRILVKNYRKSTRSLYEKTKQ